MAYPTTPLTVVIEFWDGTQWVDITSDVYARGKFITIRRGFPDEGSSPEPSSCSMELRNVKYLADGVTLDWAGRYSPRNPSSIYYGLIGRNTPVRIRQTEVGEGYLYVPPLWSGGGAVSSSSAAYDFPGDIDIQVDVTLTEWESLALASGNYSHTGSDSRWVLWLNSTGNLVLTWSTTGTSPSGDVTATSTAAVPFASRERGAVRATLDVDNGASGHTVTFYTSDTIDGSWVQLGSAVVGGGTTSIASPVSSSVFLLSGAAGFALGLDDFRTEILLHAFRMKNGIGGTTVADMTGDWEAFLTGVSTGEAAHLYLQTDQAGRTWQSQAGVWAVDPRVRGIFEMSELPSRWDVSGRDAWTPVTAQGVLRRLRQGDKPSLSPMRQALSSLDPGLGLCAYWPMEEGFRAEVFATALKGASGQRAGFPLVISGDRPDAGELGVGPLLGSDAIPVLAATTTLTGVVNPDSISESIAPSFSFGCLLDAPPTTGWTDATPIVNISHETNSTGGGGTSTVATWQLRYRSGGGGDVDVRALDAAGAALATSGTIDVNLDGGSLWLTLDVSESGADASYRIRTSRIDGDGNVANTDVSATFAGLSVTHATAVTIAPSGGLTDLAIGHIALLSQSNLGYGVINWASIDDVIVSRAGEAAAARAERLAAQLTLPIRRHTPFYFYGLTEHQSRTELMGVQEVPADSLFGLFAQTLASDMALGFESRDVLGITWRGRHMLYNQPIAVTLDYEGAGEIAPDLEPTDDDLYVRNDITVKRIDGSEARAVDSTSRMGIESPPSGVGTYDERLEVSLFSDDQCQPQAYWRLHVGTWDEQRYPTVRIDMSALAKNGKTTLMAALVGLDVGDRIRIVNLPVWASVNSVDLMVLGFQETIGHPVEWTITLNCVPYGPYDVGALASDTDAGRLDTRGCVTAEALDTTETGVDVTNSDGGWSNTAEPYDIMIGGEQMTVTAAGTPGTSQTLTVTRSVNGVVKSHSVGADVTLVDPLRLVL